MQLIDYLLSRGLHPRAFAEMIDVSEVTVHRYLEGKRIPRRDIMQRIVKETGGLVTANDFFGGDNG